MSKEKKITRREAKGLSDWFEGVELPASLRVDAATFIPDLRKTIGYYRWIVENRYDSYRYVLPYYTMLKRIKELLK